MKYTKFNMDIVLRNNLRMVLWNMPVNLLIGN